MANRIRYRNPLQAVAVFDSLQQGLPQKIAIEAIRGEHHAEPVDQAENPRSLLLRQQLPIPGNQDRDRNIQQDRLAMQQMRSVAGFKGVTEGVAEIHLTEEIVLK